MIEECARAVATPERCEIASDCHTAYLAPIGVQKAPAGKGIYYATCFLYEAKLCILCKAYVTCFVLYILLTDCLRGLNV